MSSSSEQADKYALHAAAREGKREYLTLPLADPKSSQRKDADGRLPIHWAASSNQHGIVLLLSQQKTFDPDVESNLLISFLCKIQDDSGWTPLMIAASVKDGEAIVDVLLQRGADVNQKSSTLLYSSYSHSHPHSRRST
ncbi:hypothetical protein EKO27_g11704 [Xylaria grammica]|uniref:Uncharacterized protein n=1 Tax=Xylaria grammica TaxID=363999 RepID=A0A439CML4_9PEZI|nr:hypothetical protein EKO27_g11704 [Xylaria grammica]